MKNLITKAKTLPLRSFLIVTILLSLIFGKMISNTSAYCLLGAVFFPCCIFMIGQKYTREGFENTATFKWVCAYLILFLLSIFVTMTAGVNWPFSSQSVLICAFFFLFVPKNHTHQHIRTELYVLSCLMVCLYLPLELIGFISFFTGKAYHVPLISGTIRMHSGRLRIFNNTNTVAIISAMNVLFSVYALHVSRKKPIKLFFLLAIIINYVTLSFTQSRTSSIAFSAAIAACAFRGVFLGLQKKKLRWLAGIITTMIAFFLVLDGVNFVYKTTTFLTHNLAAHSYTETEEKAEATAVTSRIERSGQFNVNSSGRGDIWMSTLKYMKDHPSSLILGNGQVNAIDLIGKEHPHIAHYLNIHNSYLSSIFYCGIPFLICVLGFLSTLVLPALRMLLQPEAATERGNFVIPAMVGMILIIGIGEELLFTEYSFPNFLLYLFSGYILKYNTLSKTHLEKRSTNEN